MTVEESAFCASESVRQQALAWLVRLRGEPSQDDLAAFEAWYIADQRHADAYDALLSSWEKTAKLPVATARRRASPRRDAAPWIALAATLLLIVAGASFFHWRRASDGRATVASLTTQLGEIRAVALDDGSRLTLDTDSAVDIRFGRDERRVRLLRGRARFAVVGNEQRVFLVIAGSREIIARGGLFDVGQRPWGLTIAALKGTVDVRSTEASPSRPAIQLQPGQQLLAQDDGGSNRPVLGRAADTRWPLGMLTFADAPLGEVATSINRYNKTQIVFRDPSLATRRFTGTIKARRPAELAAMIAAMFDQRVERGPAGNLVLVPWK